MNKYLVALFLLILSPLGVAADGQRTALVLGGGGARGSAHIGVLEVLERERIPVDCVVGTSMGGLVAGSYAAGLSPKAMREKLSKADWADMFLDLADYSQISYRKKKISWRYLNGTEVGITDQGMQIQPGMVAGEKIKLFFNQLVDADLGEREIQELPLPLAIVATDIGTGERVVLRDGSLTKAMRASMSVPGLMAPIEHQGRKLVDGGLVDNVPVEVARDLCKADRVIVVNVGSPLKSADDIGSILSVTGQMIGILTQQNVDNSLAGLKEGDIYIEPDLGDITATDFALYKEAAHVGKLAAEKQIAALRSLSVDERTYKAWKNENTDQRKREITIDKVVIMPVTLVHPEYVARQIEQKEGELFDRVKLERDLIRTYGDGFYDSVDYRVITEDQKNILEITAQEKNWSSDYITFGFSLESEHRQGSNFNLRGAYRNTWLNSYGGEIFTAVNAGNEPSFEFDYYQPLNHRQEFFIEPRYFREREVVGLFADDTELAKYELDTSYGEFMAGANIGIFGEATMGWREYKIRGSANVSGLTLPDVDESYGGPMLSLNMDKRNRLYFPSRGWRSDITFFDAQDEGYNKVSVDLSGAYKMSDYVIAGRTAYVGSMQGELPFYDGVKLGGFLNMSGYASNQILGDDGFYAHIRAEHILGRMPLGLNGDLRVGFGLETAKLRTNYTIPDDDGWLDSGVIYVGSETPLGPLYLGYGFTFSGNYNLYFKLGAY
ncbi:MAG TPA: patatin-like phospholipase family protein [Cellvibrio sp.]|nr:patatin-like phospholipase family protein [Cellvibrio sp.]